jgi:hypothetical protein
VKYPGKMEEAADVQNDAKRVKEYDFTQSHATLSP